MTLLFTVIFIALIFEYINGFHDTANSIATVVSTKVLTPRQAVLLAATTNLLGAMWGTAVAKTITSGLVDTKLVHMGSEIVICALFGGIIWNLLTWWIGLPSSSSHALIGGLCGAAFASLGSARHVPVESSKFANKYFTAARTCGSASGAFTSLRIFNATLVPFGEDPAQRLSLSR